MCFFFIILYLDGSFMFGLKFYWKFCFIKLVKNICNVDIYYYVKVIIDLFLYIEFFKGLWFVIMWL